MNLAGYRDGTIPEREMSVDSMYFDDQHAKQIRAMRAAVGQWVVLIQGTSHMVVSKEV